MTDRHVLVARLVSALVQLPHGHYFHLPAAVEVSPRRGMDVPDVPGGPSSDFPGAVA